MRPVDADALLEKLQRMIDYCKNNNQINGLTALFQVGDAIMDCPTLTLPSEWVSAEDDLPKLTGKYICCVEDIHGHMWSISADYLFETKTWVGEFGEIKNKVVFWMPLPNPPNV